MKNYYAVIFSSVRSLTDNQGYSDMAKRMELLARQQPGFIEFENVRDATGKGVTISYWASLDAIKNWKANLEHLSAQKMGKEKWYSQFKVRICLVEREYSKSI